MAKKGLVSKSWLSLSRLLRELARNKMGIYKKVKNKVKDIMINMPESEYSKNARAAVGDTESTKKVRQDQWDMMAEGIKKRIRKVKGLL